MFHLKVFSYSYIDGVVHGNDCNGVEEHGVAKSRPQRPRFLLCHNRTFGEPRLLRRCCREKRHIHRDLVLVVRLRLLVCGLHSVVQLASRHVGFTNWLLLYLKIEYWVFWKKLINVKVTTSEDFYLVQPFYVH